MSVTSQRSLIIQDLVDRINSLFGPNGSHGQYFREIKLGMLRPLAGVSNRCTVSDGGQSRVAGSDDESTTERKLRIVVTLQIAAVAEHSDVEQAWRERVETMLDNLHGWLPARGVIEFVYEDDDPADIVFQSGEVEFGWEITFEAHYARLTSLRG